jgi:CarD family transcriptional regulator
MFSLNEKVVYPGHGVAHVNRIVEKKVAGQETKFYELTFLNKDATILVPIHSIDSVGIRPLSSTECVDKVFEFLAKPARKLSSYEFNATNWNKRNKEYQSKLKTGRLLDLCNIYRDLHHISIHKELSFGEKNLLQQIEMLLAEEISLVKDLGQDKAIDELRSICTYKTRKVPYVQL